MMKYAWLPLSIVGIALWAVVGSSIHADAPKIVPPVAKDQPAKTAPVVAVAKPAAVPAKSGQPLAIDAAIALDEPTVSSLASSPCDDLTFLRRVHFDLVGGPPTVAEARAFLADKDSARRSSLIDRLLANPDHSWYWSQVLDAWWMERRPAKHVDAKLWRDYLRDSLAQGKGLDTLVKEMLTADGTDEKTRPAARFVLDRELDTHLVVRDISRLFLGANLQCAQCHDHPRIDNYKQAHYHGLLAYFQRTYLFDDPKLKKKVLAEKADGEVEFQSVFDPKKITRKRAPGVPGGPERPDPVLAKDQLYISAPAKEVRGVPRHSRRSLLANDLTAGKALARNLANRFWAQLLGKGVVYPLDQIHEDNPPSHPALLDSLTDTLLQARYDHKALLRVICNSAAYQRGGEARAGQPKNAEDRLLIARLRPLSPEQMGHALLFATGQVEAERKALGAKATPEALWPRVEAQASPFIAVLAAQPGNPDQFEARLEQALFLANHSHLQQFLPPRPGNLMERLLAEKDPAKAADELYLAVFTRLSSADEKAEMARALQEKDKQTALRDLLWALLGSAEFRFIG